MESTRENENVIVGEAEESDEEEKVDTNERKHDCIIPKPVKELTVVTIDDPSIKKLKLLNKSMYENLRSLKKQMFNNTNRTLNSINHQLLKSQMELQETCLYIKSAKNSLNCFQKKLEDILASNYIPKININVPLPII